MKKTAQMPPAAKGFQCQILLITRNRSSVVIIMVVATATPYAPARLSDCLKAKTRMTVPQHRSQLKTGT